MGDQQIIPLEDGWNKEIKLKALDPLEVRFHTGFVFYILQVVFSLAIIFLYSRSCWTKVSKGSQNYFQTKITSQCTRKKLSLLLRVGSIFILCIFNVYSVVRNLETLL